MVTRTLAGSARELVKWLRQQPRSDDNDILIARGLCAAGDFASANPIVQALIVSHHEDTYDQERVHLLNLAGVIAAALGKRSDAESIASTLGGARGAYLRGWHIYGQAAIAAHLGDKARAVSLLHDAVRHGVAAVQVYDADWYLFPLRGYPPYEELIKPQG
jgi:hypothetical protein